MPFWLVTELAQSGSNAPLCLQIRPCSKVLRLQTPVSALTFSQVNGMNACRSSAGGDPRGNEGLKLPCSSVSLSLPLGYVYFVDAHVRGSRGTKALFRNTRCTNQKMFRKARRRFLSLQYLFAEDRLFAAFLPGECQERTRPMVSPPFPRELRT